MTCYVQPELKLAIEGAAKNNTLAACCLVFVSQLYLKAAEKDLTGPFAPLRSHLSRRIYTTRFYGRMLGLLRTLAAVELYDGGSYEPGKVSKRYRLSARFCTGVQPWAVPCPKLEARFDATMSAASFAGMSGTARRWIIKTYRNATFTAAAAELLPQHPFKTEESRICAQHHIENITAGRMRFKVCRVSGRIYYPVANLPKVFRRELLIDGDPVVEIDISASQPTLLATLYRDTCPEKAEFLAFVQGGNFYETIATWAGRGWSREEAKTAFFNQIAYGSFYCAEKYELLALFKERFPILATGMDRIKKLGNSVLPLRMQKMEAAVTIYGACAECAGKKLKVLPVHDSLICRRADADLVQEILARHWLKKTKMPARLKIE